MKEKQRIVTEKKDRKELIDLGEGFTPIVPKILDSILLDNFGKKNELELLGFSEVVREGFLSLYEKSSGTYTITIQYDPSNRTKIPMSLLSSLPGNTFTSFKVKIEGITEDLTAADQKDILLRELGDLFYI